MSPRRARNGGVTQAPLTKAPVDAAPTTTSKHLHLLRVPEGTPQHVIDANAPRFQGHTSTAAVGTVEALSPSGRERRNATSLGSRPGRGARPSASEQQGAVSRWELSHQLATAERLRAVSPPFPHAKPSNGTHVMKRWKRRRSCAHRPSPRRELDQRLENIPSRLLVAGQTRRRKS